MCVYGFVCLCGFAFLRVYMSVSAFICLFAFVWVRAFVCARAHARTYVCVYIFLLVFSTDAFYKCGGDISTANVRMRVYLFHISYPRAQVYGTRINNLRDEKPAYPYFIIDWPSSSMINLISWAAKPMTTISKLWKGTVRIFGCCV